MKKKQSSLNGFEKVFSFTILQTVKSKSFIASTLIMALIFVFMVPFTNMMGGNEAYVAIDGVDQTKIEKIYVASREDYVLDAFSGEDKGKEFKEWCEGIYDEVEIEAVEGDMKDLEKKMDEDNADATLYVDVNVSLETASYIIDARKTSASILGDIETSEFGDRFLAYFDELRRKESGLSDEQMEFVNTPVTFEGKMVETMEDLDGETEESSLMTESSLAFLLFIVCIMIFTMAGENIATSLITEKSTRVIEYVLVSIKPLALVFGKILASVVTVVLQVLVFGVSGFISFKVFAGEGSGTQEVMEQFALDGITSGLSIPRVILALAILFVGIATYTTIASLIGSTASKLEQLQETVMIYSMVCVVGAYTAMVLLMKSFNPEAALDMFILGFPLSAPFITPFFVVSGEISMLTGVIILLIQIVLLVLLAIFVSKVFETLILYNGAKLKLKDIIGMAKTGNGRNEKIEEEKSDAQNPKDITEDKEGGHKEDEE